MTRATIATLLLLLATAVARPTAAQQDRDGSAPSPSGAESWIRPLASLALPGAGQMLARQDRAAVYLAAEALFLVRLFGFYREAQAAEDRYQDLAFTVARGGFAPSVRDTVWDYFEQLGKYIESGPFDADPGAALLPPTDVHTYNGSIWALARRTFFTNPDSMPDPESEEYARALEFYLERAVGPDFSWSWRNAGLEQDLYRQAIRQSDEAFRRVTRQLGYLLANHLLSAIDALVAARLSRSNWPVSLAVVARPGAPHRPRIWWAVATIRF